MEQESPIGSWVGRGLVLPGLIAVGLLLVSPAAQAQQAGPVPEQGGVAPPFVVPRLETVKRMARPGRLTQREAMTSCYILQTAPQPVVGNAYVVVTDHREAAYLEPLERLTKHHAGTMIRVDDLHALADRQVRTALAQQLVAAEVRYVAVAPRLESFRENMLWACGTCCRRSIPTPSSTPCPACSSPPTPPASPRSSTARSPTGRRRVPGFTRSSSASS